MQSSTTTTSLQQRIDARTDLLQTEAARKLAVQTDRLFGLLLLLEWIAGIVIAAWLSPRAWDGLQSSIHPHLWAAVFLGGMIAAFPISLALARPGETQTRYIIACAQMLYSALLIHLSGGRIETHFHVFGSLAFLSFYRDWRVLVPATLVVALDHALRGTFWPESVFGVQVQSQWRWIEHAGWVVFEDIFLVWACLRGTKEMHLLCARQAQLEMTNERVEAEVAMKTERLESVTQELVNTARRAGMADVATGVLHNVGNALNSVNVSASVVVRTVRNSEIATLVKAGELMRTHQQDLPEFLATDAQGKQLPGFFIELAECLGQEQNTLIAELAAMEVGLDHIKQIVGAQQQHAKNGTLRQRVAPAELFEQAIAMDAGANPQDEVEVVRNFDQVSSAALDKHKVLQVLINLLSNARKSVRKATRTDKRISTSIRLIKDDSAERIEFGVTDNGVGIARENLIRIFAHGYTTHEQGHGFGLHSAVNEAREMGGDLTVSSDGNGQGATFTLRLPLGDLTDSEKLMSRKEMQPCNQH